MQSETVIVAVPAAADSWTNVGTFTIPAGVTRVVKITVSIAPDMGAAGTVRIAPVFRLIGSGLSEQSPHEFLGPSGNAVLGTSGAGTLQENNIEYNVDIPCSTGGTVVAQVNTLDEAVTAGTCRVMLTYDVGTPTQKNSMSQYVDAAATTTPDVWAAVGTITVPKSATGNDPTKIRAIALMLATDQAALALLRTSARFRLTGSGLAEGGSHEFLGPANGTMAATPGVLTYDRQTIIVEQDIPVNPGGTILVEHILDVETPTAGTAAVCLIYS